MSAAAVDDQGAAAGGIDLASVRPTPTDEELAAIMASVEVAWPRPVLVEAVAEPSRWRFSGRWWAKPLPARRRRS